MFVVIHVNALADSLDEALSLAFPALCQACTNEEVLLDMDSEAPVFQPPVQAGILGKSTSVVKYRIAVSTELFLNC